MQFLEATTSKFMTYFLYLLYCTLLCIRNVTDVKFSKKIKQLDEY
jgi:hypothetical protein